MLNHGLKVTGGWEQLNFKEDTKLYIKSELNKDNGSKKDSNKASSTPKCYQPIS